MQREQSLLLQEEIDFVKNIIIDIQKSFKMLYEEFANSAMQAEKKENDLSYLHKRNTLKRKSNGMKSGIKVLEEAL